MITQVITYTLYIFATTEIQSNTEKRSDKVMFYCLFLQVTLYY